jgi:hypothetical protein
MADNRRAVTNDPVDDPDQEGYLGEGGMTLFLTNLITS